MCNTKINCEDFPLCPAGCEKALHCPMYHAALKEGHPDLAQFLQDMAASNPGMMLSAAQKGCIAMAKAKAHAGANLLANANNARVTAGAAGAADIADAGYIADAPAEANAAAVSSEAPGISAASAASEVYEISAASEISAAPGAIPEYSDEDYITPEFRDLEVIFGEHWKPDYVPVRHQKYRLSYGGNESQAKLPAHCLDEEGNVYDVRYETHKGLMRVYLRALSHDPNTRMRLCLVPESLANMIPRPWENDDESTPAPAENYYRDKSKQEKEKKRQDFMKILTSQKVLNPSNIQSMGIPKKFQYVNLKTLNELKPMLPPNIGYTVQAVGTFAKNYRWQYLCREGQAVGVKEYIIAQYTGVPAGISTDGEAGEKVPEKQAAEKPAATQLELFSEAADSGESAGSAESADSAESAGSADISKIAAAKEVTEAAQAPKEPENSKPFIPKKLDGLVLYGNMGTLKTSLAVSFLKTAIAVDIKCHMIDMATYKSDYMEQDGASERRKNLTKIPILLIDNLGREKWKTDIESIIEKRYNMKLMTVITTNLNPEEIAAKYSPELWDRIQEVSTVIQFTGNSLRESLSQSG